MSNRQYQTPLFCSLAAAGLLSLLFAAGAATTVAIPTAEATTYQIRTQTAARATQHLRSDRRLAAPRVLSQSLTLAAYNLRDTPERDLDARLRIRYSTDLGLNERFRRDPLFDSRWNDLSLDIAYLVWRPTDALEITAGRQWHRNTLGISDFDGLAVSWESPGGDWRPFVDLAAGRDVQRGLTPWDPGAWDVQGLPPNESTVLDDPWHWMGAANLGIARGRDHRAQLSAVHHRRPRSDAPDESASTTRVGASATAVPYDPMTVTTTASYHSLIDRIDRARIDVAHRIGDGVLSGGVDHRRPVFDTGSIFNLFGAQPHRSAYTTYRHPIDALATTVEARAWTRLYFDDEAPVASIGDDRAVGAALSNRHRLQLAIPFDLFWQASAQTLTGGRGGNQYLGSARLRAPGPVDDLFLTGRLTALWAQPRHHRRDAGVATTAGAGAELGVGEIAQFSLNFETRVGTYVPTNTAIFAHFELEAWR